MDGQGRPKTSWRQCITVLKSWIRSSSSSITRRDYKSYRLRTLACSCQYAPLYICALHESGELHQYCIKRLTSSLLGLFQAKAVADGSRPRLTLPACIYEPNGFTGTIVPSVKHRLTTQQCGVPYEV